MNSKKSILFICTHNAARSQMAEALTNAYFSDKYQAYSAGVEPSRVHPMAIKVLQEKGIDTSAMTSKHIETFLDKDIDLVVTVCNAAKESCPIFPGAKKTIHQSFLDPSAIEADEEEMLQAFRNIRDEILTWLKTIL